MSLTAPPVPFPWIRDLLANALLKRARTMSVSATHALATIEVTRWRYIISVLEADYDIRVAVREATLEAPDSPGQTQLMCILTMYEMLPADKKRAFIDGLKTAGTVNGQAPVALAIATAHQSGHIPPVGDP